MFTLQLDWDLPAKISSQDTYHVLRVRMVPTANAPQLPLHVAIALDTSSSMHGEKLDRAKDACRSVVRQLRDNDRLSLASFATAVSPLLESHSKHNAETAIAQLYANGVTRTDLALDWLQRTLPAQSGIARIAILVTDGHPTTNQGKILANTESLIQTAREFAEAGITLFTVGLGNAAQFNTDFLVSLSDRGRGAFLYADTPDSLEPQLKEQLANCQAIAFDEVRLKLTPLNQASVESFCRYRPEYLPLEETAPNELILTAVSATEPTDVLIEVNVPPQDFHDATAKQAVLEVQLQAQGTNSVSEKASIEYTHSYKTAQSVNRDVELDRLGWEINLNSTELPRSQDPNRTGELLSNIQIAAYKSGRTDLMQQAAQQLQELEKSGKLDAGKVTGLLRDTRKTGGTQP
ncbi:vWA domain-containing protein [Baaleninema sp.]|uniref:vWA domain-containing protein n=1 Tax=Baaleninema sp. TaxID=3101197 RepID=UPI003CFEE05D